VERREREHKETIRYIKEKIIERGERVEREKREE
jgi:hypothetical protein